MLPMRQPLWIINVSLVLLLLVSQALFFVLQKTVPRRSSLEPDVIKLVEKKIDSDVDIKQIYGVNDLFGTFVPEVPTVAKDLEIHIPAIPEPPKPIPLQIPIEKPPVFIAPLSVTLKGVIYLHDDQDNSLAIIQFKDSKKENNYRIGELIQDAQILKIFPNRVLVVRSNGQQETLYLREEDAQKDLSFEEQKEIEGMKIPFKSGQYHVPLEAFLAQVQSLGQFIDLLDLTTVYQKGKSIGCRVGRAPKGSLATKLGLETDDIIKKIDSIPVTSLNSRVELYDHIIEKKVGDVIHVEFDRSGTSEHYSYVLTDHVGGKNIIDDPKTKGKDKKQQVDLRESQVYDMEQQKKKIFEQRVKLAPTAHQIQMDEQRKIMEARRKSMLSHNNNVFRR